MAFYVCSRISGVTGLVRYSSFLLLTIDGYFLFLELSVVFTFYYIMLSVLMDNY